MIITTGVQNESVISRLELRLFLEDPDVTNLYILAMDQMMRIKQNDPTSWFQIAAIHGRPYIPYDGVGEKGIFGGYCTHSSVLFPSWHRPYLALMEQSLSKHIHEIAREYKDPGDRRTYLAAADRFRLPYWDWAMDPTLPDIVAVKEKVEVYLPDGTKKEIRNPLFGYFFNPVYNEFDDGLPDEKMWEAWKATYRYPTSTDANAKSEPSLMQGTLWNNRLTLRDRTYNILTQTKDYFLFSHDDHPEGYHPPSGFDSIESIHNQIHGLAGRNGHMGVVEHAAFDPVFWLHHANVDRLFAIWQVMNPEAWVTPAKSGGATFTRKKGEMENAETPLTPFRRAADKFWTSNEVRDTHAFNYTYPELNDWEQLSKEDKSLRLAKDILTLYGPVPEEHAAAQSGAAPAPAPASATAKAPTPAPSKAPELAPAKAPEPAPIIAVGHRHAIHRHVITHTLAGVAKTIASDLKAISRHIAACQSRHEWIANIAVEKYAVKSTFFVHLFLGEVDDDHKKWGIHPNLVGSHVIFANNADYTGCEKCLHALEDKKVVTGTIPLTGCLGARLGGIENLAPDTVTPYLQKNLHWRVQKHDTTPVDLKLVPSLRISVGHSVVELNTAGVFPSWGGIQLHKKVTAGRAGGHA